MIKDAFYFTHDSNARNDEKILALRMRHKSAGYGVYFMILERLRDSKDYLHIKDYNLIAFDIRESSELIKSVVEDFGLFEFTENEEGKFFYSKSFCSRLDGRDTTREKARISGMKGNLIKYKIVSKNALINMSDDDVINLYNKQFNKDVATRSQPDRNPIAKKGEDKIGEERIGDKKSDPPHDVFPGIKSNQNLTYEETLSQLENEYSWKHEIQKNFKSLNDDESFKIAIKQFMTDTNMDGKYPRLISDTKQHFRNCLQKGKYLNSPKPKYDSGIYEDCPRID